MIFKENTIYSIFGKGFLCYRVDFPYYYFKKLETNTIYKLHDKHDVIALLNFKECSSLEKELM